MKNKTFSRRVNASMGIFLLALSSFSHGAFLVYSPTGFSTGIAITDIDDGDGNWSLTMLGPQGTLAFDTLNAVGDIRAFGQITLIDNASFALQYDFIGDTVFSGALQGSPPVSLATFGSGSSPLKPGDTWNAIYDGNSSYNLFSPLPFMPVVTLGDIAGSIHMTLEEIDGDAYRFSVVEPLGELTWVGFEGLLNTIDQLGLPLGGTPNRFDGTMIIAAGSQIVSTPIPATLPLLGSVLAGLAVLARRRRQAL